MGKYKPPVVGLATGEKVVQYARNVDLKEKMTQVKDSCTSVFRRRKHGSTETSDANAEEKEKETTTSKLGSIFKHRSTGAGNVD
jgi:adenylyl- and sulfurtransferase ThiI